MVKRKSPKVRRIRKAPSAGQRARVAHDRSIKVSNSLHGDLDSAQDDSLANIPTIIGVGASAGGLEAFSQLLEALPPLPNAAIIFVQHLSPQHESALQGLLSARTTLPVVQVVEGTRIQPQHVYVIPPNAQMGVSDGVLHLLPRPFDRTQFTPIDFFLQSLARWAHGRAIGVILSGTASDGSAGSREN